MGADFILGSRERRMIEASAVRILNGLRLIVKDNQEAGELLDELEVILFNILFHTDKRLDHLERRLWLVTRASAKGRLS
ncbi:MAG: hypothetical protein WAN11_16805 [Syntrophobacteraceae bacterium]